MPDQISCDKLHEEATGRITKSEGAVIEGNGRICSKHSQTIVQEGEFIMISKSAATAGLRLALVDGAGNIRNTLAVAAKRISTAKHDPLIDGVIAIGIYSTTSTITAVI